MIILRNLNLRKAYESHIVRSLDFFVIAKEAFFVFELLEQSLRDYLQQHGSLLLIDVKGIMRQLLTALAKLKEMKIIHSDLNLDNIMLVDSRKKPFQIKLIDFGLAIQLPAEKYPLHLQHLLDSAPEVTLGLPFDEAVDMWASGVVCAELLLGRLLFPGNSPYEMLQYICEMLGLPPGHMLCDNEKAAEFFTRDKTTNNSDEPLQWRLKTPEECRSERSSMSTFSRKSVVASVDEVLTINATKTAKIGMSFRADFIARKQCAHLLRRMLEIDPSKRVTPTEGLLHGFFF